MISRMGSSTLTKKILCQGALREDDNRPLWRRTTATAAGSGPLVRPSRHFGPEPQPRSASSEIDDGAGHVFVTHLVLADGVAVCQAKKSCHILRVDEIVDIDLATHADDLTYVSGGDLTHGTFRPMAPLPYGCKEKVAPAVGKHPGAWP